MFQSFLLQAPQGRISLSSSGWIQTKTWTSAVIPASQARRKSEKELQLAAARWWCGFPRAAHLSAVSLQKAQKELQALFLNIFPSHSTLFQRSLLLFHSQMSQTQDLAGDRAKCHPLDLIILQSRKCTHVDFFSW